MGLIETLSKEYPVPYKRTRDMSESEYMKLVDRNTDLLDKNKTLKEEIERLNNIINELEKYIKNNKVAIGIKKNSNYAIPVEYALDKLQELKGSDKE